MNLLVNTLPQTQQLVKPVIATPSGGISSPLPCCEYRCLFHKGKIEWHHPVANRFDLGFHLCEAHHSILLGRKRRYPEEQLIDKTLAEIRQELKDMEFALLSPHGLIADKR